MPGFPVIAVHPQMCDGCGRSPIVGAGGARVTRGLAKLGMRRFINTLRVPAVNEKVKVARQWSTGAAADAYWLGRVPGAGQHNWSSSTH